MEAPELNGKTHSRVCEHCSTALLGKTYCRCEGATAARIIRKTKEPVMATQKRAPVKVKETPKPGLFAAEEAAYSAVMALPPMARAFIVEKLRKAA